MSLDDLAKKLADRSRIGLTAELADQLKLRTVDATRGQLMAMSDGDNTPLGVYLLGVYVVDDTDIWGDGEIYWYSIPVLTDKAGKTRWGATSGIPNASEPHKTGSLEWMTNISMADPPLLAAIPPDDDLASCTIRLAFYDDDGAKADLPKAMTEGYRALSRLMNEGLAGPDQVITPVRDAIFRALKQEEDDILLDEDVTIRRGGTLKFSAGLVGSVINALVRVYYFVRDDARTEQIGPIQLRKGQIEPMRFSSLIERGGRVAIFARGAKVETSSFGDLDTDTPFANRVLDEKTAASLQNGFRVSATGAAKVIAFYTPA